jgi:hypothetical protein
MVLDNREARQLGHPIKIALADSPKMGENNLGKDHFLVSSDE